MDLSNLIILLTFFAKIFAESSNVHQVAQNILDDKLKSHGLLKRNPPDSKLDAIPGFHSKTVDSKLENKLAKLKLGRKRRDEEQAKKDIETAEVFSAVAAVHAEKAKENALHALQDDEKIEKDLENMHSPSQNIPTNFDSPGRTYQNSNLTSYSQNVAKGSQGEANDETYYADDDEDGVEEIIDDGVATIKTSISSTHNRHPSTKENLTQPQSRSSWEEPNENGRSQLNDGGNMCQGLINLNSMAQDFYQRLQSLIYREEQLVERLDQLQTSLDKSVQEIDHNVKRRTVEPSKACVYIEEKVSDQSNHESKSSRQEEANQSSGRSQDDTEPKVHVYTSNEVLSRGSSRRNHGKAIRSSDIDLENIYWIKSNHEDQGLNFKSGPLLKEIQREGHDVLIIPISSRYKDTRQVAESFLGTMNPRSLFKGRLARRKLRLRVHRI